MKHRLNRLSESERLKIVWNTETSDELDYCKTLYYAAYAIENYGSALRDNSFQDLVAIGRRIETDGGAE